MKACKWCAAESHSDYCCERHEELCLDYPVLFGGNDGKNETESPLVETLSENLSGVLQCLSV